METRRHERPICAIDAEGDNGKKGLLGVAFYDGVSGSYITNHEDIYSTLYDYANDGYDFVAHNAQYDLVVIFWQLDIDAQAVFYNQRFNHGRWFYDKEKPATRIWDTLSISAFMSLKKLGHAIGTPKLETPCNLLDIPCNSPSWICTIHNLPECHECYAIRDSEIAYLYYHHYKDLLSQYKVPPKHTLGSSAVAIWKKTDPNQSDYIKSKEIAQFVRDSYHGGRCEPFKYGKIKKVYTADVQSMYPYIMSTNAMPDTRYLEYIDHEHENISLLKYEGVSECLINQPPVYIPILPLYLGSKLLFPVGTFHGTWTHCELRALIAHGGKIIKFHRTVISRKLVTPFQNYIHEMIQLRNNYKLAKDPREYVAKILANSLYGRMGLKSEQEQSIYIRWDGRKDLREYQGWDMDIQENGIYLTKTIERNQVSHEANIMWATYITSLARLRLYEFLIAQGNNLIYCDTDSIYSTKPVVGVADGFGNLNLDTTFDSGYFKGPKLYRLDSKTSDNKIRARGVPAAVAASYIETGYAEFQSPLTIKEALVRKANAGEWVQMHRTQQFTHTKRQLLDPNALLRKNGYSDTIPLMIGLDGDVFGEW